jgi:hypothetical protein
MIKQERSPSMQFVIFTDIHTTYGSCDSLEEAVGFAKSRPGFQVFDSNSQKYLFKSPPVKYMNKTAFQNGRARAEREIAGKIKFKNDSPKMQAYRDWVKKEGHVTASASSVLKAYCDEKGLSDVDYKDLASELGFYKKGF